MIGDRKTDCARRAFRSVGVGPVPSSPLHSPMLSLAAYPMMRRDRERLGLREWRAAWLLGLMVREYRTLEAGDAAVTGVLWDGMVEVFQWPRGVVVR